MFKKNNFSLNILYIIYIFLIKITKITSYVSLPIYTLNKENLISKNIPNSVEDLFFGEYCSPLYTEIEVGYPSQKIPLLVEIKTNDFVITSINKMEGNQNSFYSNKTLYDFKEILKKYSFFNEKKSNTFISEFCMNREIYYNYEEYENAVSEESCPAYDIFYLFDNLDMKKKIKINNAYFDLVKNIKDNVTGYLGLHLWKNSRTQSSFLYLLKKNNLTKNYNFFFDFNNAKEKSGKLIIGSFPDELYQNNFKRNDLYYTEGSQGFYYYNMKFDKIYIKYNDTLIYNIENKDFELDFDHDAIIADFEYKKLLMEYLKDLLDDKRCFSSEFRGCSDFYETSKLNITFFYCKNDGNIYDELKKRILPIKFFNHEFNNYTFEILSEDILIQKEKYIFIKIIFPMFSYTWTLGKPFSLKYKFLFNPEVRQIGFYVKSNGDDNKGNNILKYFLYIMLIIILIAIFVVVGIILGKKIYGLKRKKRANEMEDDYEYFEGKIKTDNENGGNKAGMNYDTIN
jgi:hypothetical protein